MAWLHGLVNRAIQCFVVDTQGVSAWEALAAATVSGIADYEAISRYPDGITEDLLTVACQALRKPRERLLEDIGTWLVTGRAEMPVRRLLRFGGTDYVEFLHSLDELPGRAKLAVEGLDLPAIELREHTPESFTVTLGGRMQGFAHVLHGILQAMADDYGVLAMFEARRDAGGGEAVDITLFKTDYARGNSFVLASRTS